MRYFTRGWSNGEFSDEENNAIRSAYDARLLEIASRLTASMTRLGRDVSLHDAVIESVRWRPALGELNLRLVSETSEGGYQAIHLTYRGAMLGERRIESLRNAACSRETCILHQEIDIVDDGVFSHRLLFWPRDEVTIDFSELEFVCAPRDDCRVTLGGAFVTDDEGEDDEEGHAPA